jgi:ATP-binding cassette subfamily F protein uup
VLLVTHDRYFLDKVATAILAFEGDGHATRYPGNYEMYRTLKEQAPRALPLPRQEPGERAGVRGSGAAPRSRPRRLSFNEQRELEGMEAAILAAEERKAGLEAALADPETYRKDGAGVARLRAELDAAAADVERLYARWQELEALRSEI